MSDEFTPKHIIVLGVPKVNLEEVYPELDPDAGFTYIDSVVDLVPEGDHSQDADDAAVNQLLYYIKHSVPVYLAKKLDREDSRIIRKVMTLRPDMIWDESLNSLHAQVEAERCETPEQFMERYYDAMEKFEPTGPGIEFSIEEDDGIVYFWPTGRLAQQHTLRWCPDGTIELDGMVMRRTALMGVGHIKQEVLGNRVLDAHEVVGFIACRLVTNGIDDLIGYGRAFGPGKEDQTNATLTAGGRRFRAHGVVGVVAAYETTVAKAKHGMVEEVVYELRKLFPDEFILPHQQMREIYFGETAAVEFRAIREENGEWTLHGKSSKHTRVDTGAYCLYTTEGGYVTLPALVGAFECGNDGSVYAPKNLLDGVSGWLKETVGAIRDFQNMSPDLRSRYYNAQLHVKVGDVIQPEQHLFEMDGLIHTWETKADWGVVTKVTDDMTDKLVEVRIEIDAYFEGDLKMRGFGKGLVCPAEAAGITGMVQGEKNVDRVVIGAPGIIKDSAAAREYMSNARAVVGTCIAEYCARDYELAKLKHQPAEVDGKLVKHYETGVTMYFNDAKRRVVEVDPNAIACDIKCMIEAAPVAQSVGTSGMTMPQMAWLSSLPTGNTWLKQHALPGVIKRTNALAYLHTVKNRRPMETRK